MRYIGIEAVVRTLRLAPVPTRKYLYGEVPTTTAGGGHRKRKTIEREVGGFLRHCGARPSIFIRTGDGLHDGLLGPGPGRHGGDTGTSAERALRVARSDSIPYLTIRDIRRLFNGIWIYLDHPHQLSVPGIYQMAKWPLPRLTRMALEPAGSTPYTMHVRHESAHVVAVALVRERRQRRPILGHW